jgi:molybdopterin-guanine dinucleotide biosynthesis protein A
LNVTFDAIVLAGGAARRMGGADKALLEVGGRSLLERALEAVAGATATIVVGPVRDTRRTVTFVREDPPGCGPAAAVMRGVAEAASPVVVVLAVDVPFAASAVPRLLAAVSGYDAAMLVDETGRRQPLIAAYQVKPLRGRAADRPWADRSMRALIEGLSVAEVAAVGDEPLDCDTPADLERAASAR